MKLIFYLPDLRAGGAERVLLSLAEYIGANAPITVKLLVNTTQGKLYGQYHKRIRIISLNASGYIKPIWPLIKYLRKERPDVIVSSLNATMVVAFSSFFLPKQLKRISRLGNTIGAEKHQFPNWKAKLYLRLHHFVFRKSHLVICQSDYMLHDYFQELNLKHPSKVIKIYNPVNVPNERITVHQKKVEFICVARLFPQKDILTLLKAMDILREKNPCHKLIILGEGPERSKLEKEIDRLGLHENVSLKGYIADTSNELKSAQVFVLSSIYEGFSNALLEALALGLPAVVSNCPGGNAEVIKEGFNGYLFKMSDAQDMAFKMEKALSHYNSFDYLAIREDIQHRFGIKKIANEYLNALKQLK